MCSAAAALAAHAILSCADLRASFTATPRTGLATADLNSFDDKFDLDTHRLNVDVPSLHDHSFAPTISPPPPPPPPPPRGDGDAPRPQLRRARESSASQPSAAVLSFPTAAKPSVYEEAHVAQAAETGRCSACGAYASRIEWDEAQLAWYYGTNDGRTA